MVALCLSVDEDVAKSQVEDYCKQVLGEYHNGNK